MTDSLKGYIRSIIFRNDSNGYTVMSLVSDDEEYTCVGCFDSIHPGETVELYGHFTEHPVYGSQFKTDRYELRAPEDTEGIIRYLGSGAIRGIGEKLAARIVRYFGNDTLRIMQEEPERLAEIKGISERIARNISEQVREQEGIREAVMFLKNYDVSMTLGLKIYNTYGQDMYRILRENPYRLAEDIEGVGFKTADEIASRIGFSPDSSFRIRSALIHVLSQTISEGSMFMPYSKLIGDASGLIGVVPELVENTLNTLILQRDVITREKEDLGTIVYLAKYYYVEMGVARKLTDLNVICEEDRDKIAEKVEKLNSSGSFVLDEEQAEAVRKCAACGVVIITGGPGTGKTTTINEIIRYFRQEGKNVMLAAPTGRAAKRMTETTGYEASTIHRLLEIGPSALESGHSFIFSRNRDNPLDGDVVIIDEMSMVDIFLMNSLLEAVKVGTRLVLVGDVDQLPSVGPGSVLRDIIASDTFPTVKLKKIFRQSEVSDIVVNAHKINKGEHFPVGNKSRDFFFLKRDDENRIISNMIELINGKLSGYVDARPFDIQVLTPMRKGLLGVERINRILQRYLNPASPEKKEHSFSDGLFRVGDKVMQIKNDYQIEWEIRGKYDIVSERGTGIFNGDMGIVCDMDEFSSVLSVKFDDGRIADYGFDMLDEIELAYAVTIHKSQGSEYPAVIIPILKGSPMLMNRNLLYTAVTRARKCVVILGSEDMMNAMIDNSSELRRYTSLKERIHEIQI
ncbi:MAG: ATP-dependent RecD-like DNA helicase [Lachnospiraceae bacterium]|jgi:exodeoxyribonuclease V alpha subunit